MRCAAIVCECGHDLGVHIPDPARPFAWPCRLCECREYREKTYDRVYILGTVAWIPTLLYVRVSRGNDGRYHVYEGLTNQ